MTAKFKEMIYAIFLLCFGLLNFGMPANGQSSEHHYSLDQLQKFPTQAEIDFRSQYNRLIKNPSKQNLLKIIDLFNDKTSDDGTIYEPRVLDDDINYYLDSKDSDLIKGGILIAGVCNVSFTSYFTASPQLKERLFTSLKKISDVALLNKSSGRVQESRDAYLVLLTYYESNLSRTAYEESQIQLGHNVYAMAHDSDVKTRLFSIDCLWHLKAASVGGIKGIVVLDLIKDKDNNVKKSVLLFLAGGSGESGLYPEQQINNELKYQLITINALKDIKNLSQKSELRKCATDAYETVNAASDIIQRLSRASGYKSHNISWL